MSDGTVSRYVNFGVEPGTWRQRRESEIRAAVIKSEVKVAKDLIDGVREVYDYTMEAMMWLDDKRELLAKNNPARGMLLGRLELKAQNKIERIAGGVFE